MLNEPDLLNTCRNISKRFVRQGIRILNGTPDEVLDELTNVAYVVSKSIKNPDGLKSWIIWMLAKYLSDPKTPLIDRRVNIIRDLPLTPDAIAIINEQKALLLKSLKKLDPEKLNTLSLRYKEGMTLSKIAECHGVSRTKIANDIREIFDDIKKEMKG